MLTELRVLEDVLLAHAPQLGADLPGYRNHAYRVANLCAALRPPDADSHERIAIAAALHDLGIWTADTFDYLPPSIELAWRCDGCHGNGRGQRRRSRRRAAAADGPYADPESSSLPKP